MAVKFKATKQERILINAIAERIIALAKANEMKPRDKIDILMDVEACHCNGCRLGLTDLLQSDDFDLVHDVMGIAKHINRDTGKLQECFLPRYSLGKASK